MNPYSAQRGLERVSAKRNAFWEECRRIVPLHHFQQAKLPLLPQGPPHDRQVQLPQLEPRIGCVLVLDLHYRADTFARIKKETIRLTPTNVPTVAKTKPLSGEVSRASKVAQVLMDAPLVSDSLSPPARVAAVPGEIERHVMCGMRPVNRRRRPKSPRAGEGLQRRRPGDIVGGPHRASPYPQRRRCFAGW